MAGFGLMAVLFLNPTANLFLNFYEIIFRFTGNRKGLRVRGVRFGKQTSIKIKLKN